MSDLINPSILSQALLAEAVELGLFDSDLILQAATPGLGALLLAQETKELKGQKITHLFPELVGSETVLDDILQQRRQFFRLDFIHRPGLDRNHYVNLHVEACSHGLLVILRRSTPEGELSQHLMQQRNELHILASSLNRVRARLGHFLRRYVPTDVMDQLYPTQDLGGTSGEIRQITALAIHLHGFNQWAGNQRPEIAMAFLNGILENIFERLRLCNASLENAAGGRILAYFNTPQPQPDHARQAFLCAQALENVKILRSEYIHLGIGLDTSPVLVGSVGLPRPAGVTAIGVAPTTALALSSLLCEGRLRLSQRTADLLSEMIEPLPKHIRSVQTPDEAVTYYEIQ